MGSRQGEGGGTKTWMSRGADRPGVRNSLAPDSGVGSGPWSWPVSGACVVSQIENLAPDSLTEPGQCPTLSSQACKLMKLFAFDMMVIGRLVLKSRSRQGYLSFPPTKIKKHKTERGIGTQELQRVMSNNLKTRRKVSPLKC